jgi:cytochrome P450
MLKLSKGSDAPDVRAVFAKTMEGSFDQASGGVAFTPLEAFVMELMRTISPNGGSISALQETRAPPFKRHGYLLTPHTSTSLDSRHWDDPERFDPTRYSGVPTNNEIDSADRFGQFIVPTPKRSLCFCWRTRRKRLRKD